MFVSEAKIREGQAIVEELFRYEFKGLDLGEPRFEWSPEDDHIRFPVWVTLESSAAGRAHVCLFPRALLENRETPRLRGLVRAFAADIAKQERA